MWKGESAAGLAVWTQGEALYNAVDKRRVEDVKRLLMKPHCSVPELIRLKLQDPRCRNVRIPNVRSKHLQVVQSVGDGSSGRRRRGRGRPATPPRKPPGARPFGAVGGFRPNGK